MLFMIFLISLALLYIRCLALLHLSKQIHFICIPFQYILARAVWIMKDLLLVLNFYFIHKYCAIKGGLAKHHCITKVVNVREFQIVLEL